MPVTLKDADKGIGVTNYADTVVFDGKKNIVVIRFGGYPETVLSMSDAIFSGCSVCIRLPNEKTEAVLSSKGVRNYERRIINYETGAECVMKVKDDEVSGSGEKAQRNIYIYSAKARKNCFPSWTGSCRFRCCHAGANTLSVN